MMKLYAISCGRIRCRKNVFVPDADRNEFIESPMPVFAISHPQGNVLFDTGPHPDVFKNAAFRWGGLAKAFEPVGDEKSGILAQLENISFEPSNIKYVGNSHLHFDHAGGLLVTMLSLEDQKNPNIRPYMKKYLMGKAGVDSENRMRLIRLIENITMGTGAVSYLTESIHGAGSPQAQKIMITRLADLESAKSYAYQLCGIQNLQ
jgi:metal-dependent hydrolase (beta-lactamase superfamily II)